MLSKLSPKTIKVKLILAVAFVHAILMTIFVSDIVHRERAFLIEQNQEQALLIAKTVSASSVSRMMMDDDSISEIACGLKDLPNLDFVMIVKPKGEIVAHTTKTLVGTIAEDEESRVMLSSNQQHLSLSEALGTIDIAYKIAFEDKTLGWVRVALNDNKISAKIESILLEGALYTLIAILIGSMVAWTLGNNLTKRIRLLIEATKDVGPSKVNIEYGAEADDEISELMNNFKQMGKKLSTQFHEMQNMAYSDALTGLYSRAFFDIAFEVVAERSNELNKEAGLVIIDIDDFKQLNDSYGHDFGDKLLLTISERLLSCIHSKDYAFRFGGDEFVVILADLSTSTSKSVLEGLVQNLHQVISQPCDLNSLIYTPRVSIGANLIGFEQPSSEALKKADIALYNAKRLGKGQVSFFLKEMEDEIKQRNYYEEGLQHALNNHELSWVIQPQMNMKTDELVGGEVLLRWNYRGEFVRPDVFIPITEANQTIIPISNWLFNDVFEWLSEHSLSHFKISLNLSPVHFFDSDLVPFLKQMMFKHQLSPYHIKLEVTEGVFLEQMEKALSIISHLKTLGFRISLDDFGTGFSSLSYLKNLPIDQLKIDKSFVDGLPDNQKPAAIAKTIIDLTQNLELSVIAEGVESEEQKAFLMENDCLYCQGYLYSKPLTPEEFLLFSERFEALKKDTE